MFKDFVDFVSGETERRSERRFWLGTVFAALSGLAAGGILGLIFAPKSGKETRKDISKVANEGYDKVKETANDFGDMVSEETGKINSKVSDTYNEFKDNVEDAKDKRKAARIARRNQRTEVSEHPVAGQTQVPNVD